MRTIALLGSTGSIGISTLDVVRRFPERFKVYGLGMLQGASAAGTSQRLSASIDSATVRPVTQS